MRKVSFSFLLILLIIFFGGQYIFSLYKHNTNTNKIYFVQKGNSTNKTYVVQKGDSINRIASMHHILPWQLRKANAMESGETLLHPRQKLKIPMIEWKSYEGRASWYGPGFHGKRMANGQIYNQNKILVAHRTLPLGLKVRVTNLENSKSIVARVLDRGPYTKKRGKYDREIDLSYAAAKMLGAVRPGVIPVRITPLL